MKLSELREQWKGKEQKLQLLELFLYLSLATLFLYIFNKHVDVWSICLYWLGLVNI